MDSILYNVGILAVAKRSRSNSFEVANEVLSLALGQALNLPVPPGIPMTLADGNVYYASLNFAGVGHKLPPVDLGGFVRRQSHLACGIALFDSWICNEDRHDENLSWIQTDTIEDEQVQIFDHGRALFSDAGIERLLSYEDRLPKPELAAEITTLKYFDEWDDQLRRISPKYIQKAVEQSRELYGLTVPQTRTLVDFIDRRRFKLRGMFAVDQDERKVFQSLEPQLWRIRDDREDKGCADDLEYHI